MMREAFFGSGACHRELRGGSARALAALAALAVLASLIAATLGPVPMAPAEVLGSLLGLEGLERLPAREEAILWSLRLPRVCLAAVVGAALAAGGVAMQGITRNPLADPSLLGVSSGAAVGACGFVVLGAPLVAAAPTAGAWLLPGCAFAGALGFSLAALALARLGDSSSTLGLILGGVALAALGGALTGVLVFVADDAQLRSITFWSLGSLAGASWPGVGAVAVPALVAALLLLRAAPALDRLQLGEAEARHLGVRVARTRALAVVATALGAGAAVAHCGVIGFVGLVAAHAMRTWLGPTHRGLLPAAMLGGAVLLIVADTLARMVVAPTELPVGVVTALLGAPVLLALVRLHLQRGQR